MREFEIDGAQVSSLEELMVLFLDPILVQTGLIPEGFRPENVDSLSDALSGWLQRAGDRR